MHRKNKVKTKQPIGDEESEASRHWKIESENGRVSPSIGDTVRPWHMAVGSLVVVAVVAALVVVVVLGLFFPKTFLFFFHLAAVEENGTDE